MRVLSVRKEPGPAPGTNSRVGEVGNKGVEPNFLAESGNKGVEPSFPAESGVGAGGNTVTCWRELSVSSAYSTTAFSLGQVLKYVTVLPLATVPRYPPRR